MKKRYIYGTVIIDMETKKIVDLLDSRDLDDVVEWLKTYPNLEIVSRDGSLTYAAAIRKAHPHAVQISDRFHLLKNFTDYCKSYITKTLNFKIKIKHILSGDEEKQTSISTDNKKSVRIKEAQRLNLQGLSEREISLQLKMDIRTVKKYIASTSDILSKDTSQKNMSKQLVRKI